MGIIGIIIVLRLMTHSLRAFWWWSSTSACPKLTDRLTGRLRSETCLSTPLLYRSSRVSCVTWVTFKIQHSTFNISLNINLLQIISFSWDMAKVLLFGFDNPLAHNCNPQSILWHYRLFMASASSVYLTASARFFMLFQNVFYKQCTYNCVHYSQNIQEICRIHYTYFESE